MIERICEQQLPISAVLLQRRDLIHLEITTNEWRILEDLLRPFKVATVHLSGEKYPTISALGPLLEEIKKRVEEDESDSVAMKAVKKVLRDDIKSRYRNPDVRLLFDKASFLDPRFKSLSHLPSVQQLEVIDSVKEELLVMLHMPADDSCDPGDERSRLEDDCVNDEAGPAEPPNKKAKSALIDILGDSFTQQAVQNTSAIETREDLVHAEILRYKAEATIFLDQDPLAWWGTHSYFFPSLSQLAQKYLCVVATSVPSEQVFSTAGNVVSSKRSSLLPENVNKLVFLHDNLPKHELSYKRTQ